MSTGRPPYLLSNRSRQTLNVLEYKFLAEKAAALSCAGNRVVKAMARLNEHGGDIDQRRVLLKEATDTAYAYFIHRELCGLRKYDNAMRDYAIPARGIWCASAPSDRQAALFGRKTQPTQSTIPKAGRARLSGCVHDSRKAVQTSPLSKGFHYLASSPRQYAHVPCRIWTKRAFTHRIEFQVLEDFLA